MSELNKMIEAVVEGAHNRDVYDLAIAAGMDEDSVDNICGANDGSLDAALALHEALLPGWRMDALWQGGTLCRNENDWSCRLRCVYEKRRAIENDEREALHTPACAWLLAILRAYRSIQQ